MAAITEIIDWDEAMQQCGDDEEFLRELLGDLRSETDAQVLSVEAIIQVGEAVHYLLFGICVLHRWYLPDSV
jgi:hypothetical protein